jgi:hypothetical protein
MRTASDDTPLNLSALLGQLIESHPHDRITPDDLAAHLRDRAFGGLLLVLALVNFVAVGATAVTGIPLILLAAQMAVGRAQPWWPDAIRRRGMTKASLAALLHRVGPWERRIEFVLRPRLPHLTSHRGMRVIGAVCFVLSILVWLPIPLGNHIPSAVISLFALALIYRDGVAAVIAYLGAVFAIAVLGTAYTAAVLAILYAVRTWLPGMMG